MTDHVAAVNRLTTSWLERLGPGSGVMSGAGLWPLLAVLAASADDPGRDELAAATGVPADEAMEAAAVVLRALDDADGVDAALGLWARADAQVRPDWRAEVPAGTLGELSGDPAVDQPVLDAWARERTGGLIEKFPIETGPHLAITLATALALRTTWVRRFSDEALVPSSGPWQGTRLAGLKRTTPDLDDLVVATTPAGEITATRIEGDNGLDVHLVLGGADRGPAEILPPAVAVIAGDHPVRIGSELLADHGADLGPGVSVVPATRAGLAVATPRFTVRSEHDLMRHADIFGLTAVSGPGEGHFSRISAVPLKVDEARQSAVAIFSALGFEAAAVTAIGLRAVSMPSFTTRGLAVAYDRPFGFVAVHRESGLVLFAGWVDAAEAWSAPR